jgi:hypothetical protein
MNLQVGTSRDLLDTLRVGLSPAWSVSRSSLQRRGTTRGNVVNWEGTVRIEGNYSDEMSVENHPIGRTVLGFTDGHIVLCNFKFSNTRNQVSIHYLSYKQSTREIHGYSVVGGNWPAPSRDEALSISEAE